jgi:hypothetical protein
MSASRTVRLIAVSTLVLTASVALYAIGHRSTAGMIILLWAIAVGIGACASRRDAVR